MAFAVDDGLLHPTVPTSIDSPDQHRHVAFHVERHMPSESHVIRVTPHQNSRTSSEQWTPRWDSDPSGYPLRYGGDDVDAPDRARSLMDGRSRTHTDLGKAFHRPTLVMVVGWFADQEGAAGRAEEPERAFEGDGGPTEGSRRDDIESASPTEITGNLLCTTTQHVCAGAHTEFVGRPFEEVGTASRRVEEDQVDVRPKHRHHEAGYSPTRTEIEHPDRCRYCSWRGAEVQHPEERGPVRDVVVDVTRTQEPDLPRPLQDGSECFQR